MKNKLIMALLIFVLPGLNAKAKLRVDLNEASVEQFSLEQVETIVLSGEKHYSINYTQ